jgi:hypothetical protein
MNNIYYSQTDSRWSNHPYPSQQLPHATIGSGGCGAACAAMVVSMLKEIITPDIMGDIFVRDGVRVNGGTSNRAFDSYLTEKYGLKVQRNWKIAEAKECLEKGGLVVARCTDDKGTLFTTGGHFIVLVGFKDNEFEVYDPYLYKNKFEVSYRRGKARVEGTSVFVTFENMKAYGGYNELWCYEGTGIDTNIDTTIPETKQDIPNTVGQTRKFKDDVVLYANPDLTGNWYNYLKNTTVVILENVSANVDKIRVPATGRIAYVNTSIYKDNETQQSSLYTVMTVTARTGLNVRSQPTTNSSVVTAYACGTKVKVYSVKNGWAKGTRGYLYAKYLK